jgi:hypothetical protein
MTARTGVHDYKPLQTFPAGSHLAGSLVMPFENGNTAVSSVALVKETFQHAREISGFAFE